MEVSVLGGSGEMFFWVKQVGRRVAPAPDATREKDQNPPGGNPARDLYE
jgi:hypothetical protein